MSAFEYKVVPAPTRGLKGKGVKGAEARFANAIQAFMNELAADGWEYLRAETLPSMERAGLTGTATEWRNLLVFRRTVAVDAARAPVAPVAPLPVATPEPTPTRSDPPLRQPAAQAAQEGPTAEELANPGRGATQMLPDNGVEEASEVSGMTSSLSNLAGLRKSFTAKD